MKICFFGGVYDSLIGKGLGGAELQMAILAQALSKAGHEVVIIDTHLDRAVDDIMKIKIYNCANGGIKKVRFFTQKLPNYLKLCYSINADIYYVRGRAYSQIIPLIVGKYIRKKIFIKAISSNIDVLPYLERLRRTFIYRKSFLSWLFRGVITESLFNIIMKKSSLLLLQHQQQDSPKLNSLVSKYIFRNILLTESLPLNNSKIDRNSFLYVGTLSPKKGIVELKRIIEQLPGINFQVIGPPENSKDRFFQELVGLQNVNYYGQQNREYIHSLLSHSIGLINTSPEEGFPNTFLESWYNGCPVVSLNVDPGGVISTFNLGLVCDGDPGLMVDNITKMNEGLLCFDPHVLHDYVDKYHSFESAANEFNLIIEDYRKTHGN